MSETTQIPEHRNVNPEPGTGSFNNWLIRAGIIEALIGVIAIVVFAWQFPSSARWSIMAAAAIVSCAATAVGSFVGFVFGIPRTLQSEGTPQGMEVVSNSNLEQISDWLTKIIVGVGLVEIGRLWSALGRLGDVLKPAFGGAASSNAFAVAALLYGFLIGFLLTYMWTRTRFLEVLQRFSSQITARTLSSHH